MDDQKEKRVPSLLNRLVNLTTIRDLDLFEVSLLKTMAELLKIEQISMYKLNQANTNCWLMTYSTQCIEDGNRKQLSETQEVYTSEIKMPKEIDSAQLWINTTGKPYINAQNNEYLIVYPVFSAGRLERLLSFELSHALTESEMLIITSLLSIAHNFRNLLDENQKDKLTGLLNRHTFEESIQKIQALSFNSDRKNEQVWNGENRRKLNDDSLKFCLTIIDIDNFKMINDRYGHIMGDEVLLLLSYIMKQNFRAKDLLFRFGGEEFVAIFRVQDKEEAQTVLERFREIIESYSFPQIKTVTVSIGATFIKKEQLVAAEIIGRADKALYYAKSNGKNQMHFYEDLLKSGRVVEQQEAGSIDFF